MARQVNSADPSSGFPSSRDFHQKGAISDLDLTIQNDTDKSKAIEFDASAISPTKTVTIKAGVSTGNTTITLPASTGTLAKTTDLSNAFATIQPPSGTSPTADSGDDTLNITTSDNSLTVTGTAATDTLDFKITSGTIPIITAVTNNNAYFSPSSNFGTTSQNFYTSWRIGDMLHARIYFKAGTLSATGDATITLNNHTIDSAKLPSTANVTRVGMWTQIKTGGTVNYAATSRGAVFYDGSTTNTLFVSYQHGSNTFIKSNTDILSTNDSIFIEFAVPVSGWGVAT
jgi:hypothetical protein